MGISNFLQNDLFVDKKFSSKKEALTYFCKTLEKNGYVKSAKDALNLALEREKQFPTNIGSGCYKNEIVSAKVKKYYC